MYTMDLNTWTRYRDILKAISQKAADEFRDAVWNIHGRWKGVGLGKIPRDDLIDYAYYLVTKYGEGATAAACEAYDAIAALSGVSVPPAIPAETASYSDVAQTLNGVVKQSLNEEIVSGAIGRLVKQAGQDTTLQNAKRDGAEVAWIPHGDTCAFCIALASRGWEQVSDKQLKGGHAEHIHANCDCAYGVRFDSNSGVAGYDPQKYKDMYYAPIPDAPLNGINADSKDRINAMRRQAYAQNREEINAQKRSAYAKRKELESSAAEEIKVN